MVKDAQNARTEARNALTNAVVEYVIALLAYERDDIAQAEFALNSDAGGGDLHREMAHEGDAAALSRAVGRDAERDADRARTRRDRDDSAMAPLAHSVDGGMGAVRAEEVAAVAGGDPRHVQGLARVVATAGNVAGR